MGIFDRFAKSVEQNNADAVYVQALAKLDARIAEHEDFVLKLKADRLRKQRAADGSDAGYDALVDEAELVLTQLRAQRRKLDQERIAAPAQKVVSEARVAIDDQESGVGDSATARGLTKVRDDVDALKRRASGGYLDANGTPIHGKLAKMREQSADDRARAELQRMKIEMGLVPPPDPADAPDPSEDPS